MEDGTTYLDEQLIRHFQISSEYLEQEKSHQIQEIKRRTIRTSDEFYISVVRPIEYEDHEDTKIGLSRIFDREIVTHYVRPHSLIRRDSIVILVIKIQVQALAPVKV